MIQNEIKKTESKLEEWKQGKIKGELMKILDEFHKTKSGFIKKGFSVLDFYEMLWDYKKEKIKELENKKVEQIVYQNLDLEIVSNWDFLQIFQNMLNDEKKEETKKQSKLREKWHKKYKNMSQKELQRLVNTRGLLPKSERQLIINNYLKKDDKK